MKDMTHEKLIRATYVVAKYESAQTAQLLTELAGRLDGALIAARTACAERATAMKAEIEWETAMRQATGADSVDDVVSVIEKLKSDLAEMAAENLALKEATKNGVVEKHQQTSNGICIGFKSVIVKREIDTPAIDAWVRDQRAVGAESVAAYIKRSIQHLPECDRIAYHDAIELCSGAAAQLRGRQL
jgi:hypothetical protein